MAAAGLPSIVLTLGGLLLPDTPNSLLDRGKAAEARAVLVRVRGTEDVEEELEDIRAAIKQAALVSVPALACCACTVSCLPAVCSQRPA